MQENKWCPECREGAAFQHKEPACEQCFPGINPRNLEAWEIYQLAYGSMGITPADIDVLANRFQVDDLLEIHYKISELSREIRRLTDKPKDKERTPEEWQNILGGK